jgi:toxin ParE1/3/4
LRFYDAAAATFEAIGRTPGIGEPRESPDPRLSGMRVRRIDGFENHLVFYRSAADGIEIVRVIHGVRDVDRILEAGR